MIILNALNAVEHGLSDMAPITLIGRAAGVLRVALGLIQTITAIALTILMTIPALCVKACRHTWTNCTTQVGHGLENIFAGTFEIIPIIGVIF
jgi:hypothetical protein